MFETQLKELEKQPCMRLDYKVEQEDNRAAWHYFRSKYSSLLGTIDPLSFHLPKGWRGLVEAAFSFLNENGVKVVQVKQKMGELRIYTEETCTGECARVIRVVEALAKSTCEFCSSTDRVSLFEVGYVCRTCINCKRALCEYTIMNWVLNGESEELNIAQLYCVKELRGLNEISRVAGQDS
jgi:hypothetical protein